MELPPFLLDQWISQKNSPNSPIEYDLASSTGPVWTVRDLLALSDQNELEAVLESRISYTHAAGTLALRSAIAALEGVAPDDVQVVTGASEALLILFFLAAEPEANVVLPNPGFPANTDLAAALGIEIRYYTLRAENQMSFTVNFIRKSGSLPQLSSSTSPVCLRLPIASHSLYAQFCSRYGKFLFSRPSFYLDRTPDSA